MLEDKQAIKHNAAQSSSKMATFRADFTGDEFKELFILVPKLAMIEHRLPGTFVD